MLQKNGFQIEKFYKGKKMNATKLDLCSRVSKKLGTASVKDIKSVVETFLDEVLKVLSEDKRIEIRGFGSFCVKVRKARIGRNPRTGEAVKIPEYKAPYFKFSNEAHNYFEKRIGNNGSSH
jgi:integration host factor subunit beta